MARSTIQVRGLSGLVANFHRLTRETERRVTEAVRRNGEEQRAATVREAPKRTGFLASRTRLEFSEQGRTYSVGYFEGDFSAAGQAFYAPFVLFGTRAMAGNNYLFRVHEMQAPKLTRDVGDAIRGAVRSVSR